MAPLKHVVLVDVYGVYPKEVAQSSLCLDDATLFHKPRRRDYVLPTRIPRGTHGTEGFPKPMPEPKPLLEIDQQAEKIQAHRK